MAAQKKADRKKDEEKQNKAAAKKAAMAKAQEDHAAEKSRKRSRDEAKKVETKIGSALPKLQAELAQPGTVLVPELVMSNARLAVSFLEDQLKKAKLVQDGHGDQGLVDMKTLKEKVQTAQSSAVLVTNMIKSMARLSQTNAGE